jgi:alkanesulfonate monooxygenase SsuD/methylene tetrahydromethanopterin reductase-like flavin-dependent oxidoreductase (luciferase family)
MNKGIFTIPIYPKNSTYSEILDETLHNTINAEINNISEVFFGEHLADRHEKIVSSLMMISQMSSVTKKIKLGTLTTNLNFYNPALLSGLISTADNMSKGRLILGIGSGSNQCDLEAQNLSNKNNFKLMIEELSIINKIFKSNNLPRIKTKNFLVSTKKYGNERLGLGYFNKLYKKRKNLEIVMPALNYNSKNVKVCAKNQWSIVISNFCKESIVENHIENYLKNSSLRRENALKKIRIAKMVFITQKKYDTEKYLLDRRSPYLQSIKTLYKKMKFFKREECLGEKNDNLDKIIKNLVIHGSVDDVNSQMLALKKKYGDLKSLLYVTVPKSKQKIYNESLSFFYKNVRL